MSRFLAKLRELLRLRVKDGDLSEGDFNTAVRQAAGHVGGTVRWEQARASKEFAYESLDDLPPAVRKLPEKAQKVWLAAFNSAFKAIPSEGRAAAIA
ncbi:MAG: ChaB family protein, partial [Dehalococcoidales bacterium]|nr:ChaB family protein [Dehalococcoidales bacterium]